MFSEHEDWRMTALAVAGVAGLASAGGQTTHAARLLGTAAALRQTGGLAADPAYRAINEQDEATIRAALGEAAFATAWSEGQAMPLEDALVEASAMATSIESRPPQVAPPATRFGLTQREIEVLRLLARRLTDREIAETLFISPKTAGNHVSNILAKLEATDRREAAALAARHGLA
jgi:non-specific serine/threonine protein kinase